MSWQRIISKGWGRESLTRKTFNNLDKAKRYAQSMAFHYPFVVRELRNKYTVMMEKDSWGAEHEFGPVIHTQQSRRN